MSGVSMLAIGLSVIAVMSGITAFVINFRVDRRMKKTAETWDRIAAKNAETDRLNAETDRLNAKTLKRLRATHATHQSAPADYHPYPRSRAEYPGLSGWDDLR